MSDSFTQIEIVRLENLLTGRKKEYEIFGRTAQDAQKDAEIIRKITTLKQQLNQQLK